MDKIDTAMSYFCDNETYSKWVTIWAKYIYPFIYTCAFVIAEDILKNKSRNELKSCLNVNVYATWDIN